MSLSMITALVQFKLPQRLTREDAERLFTDEWKAFIRDKYGAEPSVTYFASPVVVDNAAGEIVADA